MDSKKDSKIPQCGVLPDLRALHVIVGMKQLRKALLKGTARYVFLAENADPVVTEPIETMCRQRSVEFSWVPSKDELGKACGIEVGASAAAVLMNPDSIGYHP